MQPEFGKKGRVSITEAALTQMVMHCADEYDQMITVKKVSVTYDFRGYTLGVHIHVPFGVQISGNIHEFHNYLVDNIERYTGIMIVKLDIIIDDVGQN